MTAVGVRAGAGAPPCSVSPRTTDDPGTEWLALPGGTDGSLAPAVATQLAATMLSLTGSGILASGRPGRREKHQEGAGEDYA